MNDPRNADTARLVSALRAGEPDAVAALFDIYADRLFGYCWFMLRNADLAQIALRDALVVAQAHIGRLADIGNLDSWLYALTRAECRRRRPVPPSQADEPPAKPSQPDADSRLMAWNAVTSMEAGAAEALDLACRHDVDLGLVLGLPGQEAHDVLDAARQELAAALGAEILVSRGSHACPDRAEVMHGWTGTVSAELRERVLRHAASCAVCGPALPRNVSAMRVFALLPVPPLPSGTRERVLDFVADPRMAAYRDFAVTRVADSGPAEAATVAGGEGVPADKRTLAFPAWGRTLAIAPRARVLAAMGAAAAAAAVAAAFVLVGHGNQARGGSQGPAMTVGGPVEPRRAGAGVEGAVPVSSTPAVIRAFPRASASASELLFDKVTQPLPSSARANPPVLPPRLPGRPLPVPEPSATHSQPARGTLQASPDALALGTSSQGEVTITAEGAAQAWSASTTSAELVLGAPGGTLQAGQSATLMVTVDRAGGAGGSAVIVIDEGSTTQNVQVSWTGLPTGVGHQRPPKPSPSPSPTPSPSASSSPSSAPSPSNSSGSSPPSDPAPHSPSPRPSRYPRPRPSPVPSQSPPPAAHPRRPHTRAGAALR
jgi:DNA-directed RNA polymerase specialized sigma24 family protein